MLIHSVSAMKPKAILVCSDLYVLQVVLPDRRRFRSPADGRRPRRFDRVKSPKRLELHLGLRAVVRLGVKHELKDWACTKQIWM